MTGIDGGFAPDNTLIHFWNITWKLGNGGGNLSSQVFHLTNGRTAIGQIEVGLILTGW